MFQLQQKYNNQQLAQTALMSCSIQQLTYSYSCPQQIKQLNLSSTSNFKIHEITHLQPFLRLRVLILSNNMISQIKGLDHLRCLRILNLQFNQIKVLNGTENLINLEELYLSYNDIEFISDSIKQNKKLRILHLAYNGIQNLQSISALYQLKQVQENKQQDEQKGGQSRFSLKQLKTLSLYGNPLISTLNYLSFFKMLIPSLRVIDDKNVDDQIMYGSVCPQQQVIILREAINKLLDERNAAVQQLQNYVSVTSHPRPKSKSQIRSKQIATLRQRNESVNAKKQLDAYLLERQDRKKSSKQFVEYLQSTKEKYHIQMQGHKQRVAELSRQFTSNIARQKKKNQADEDINEQNSQVQFSPRKLNKQMLKEMRQEQDLLQLNQSKIRNINKLLAYLENQNKKVGSNDIYKSIYQIVLFGYDLDADLTLTDCQKLCKKFIIKPIFQNAKADEGKLVGLIQYTEMLKKIIYGQNEGNGMKAEYSQLCQLKSKIKNKGLLQIIAQLKELSHQQVAKFSKFQKQRIAFIENFQKQTEELGREWDYFKEQKLKWENQKKKQQKQASDAITRRQQQMRRKYKITQEQQRQKIVQLKRARQKLESQVNKMKYQLSETEQKLNRRFMQLQQFQIHFNEFIQQKQHIKSLQAQINQITFSINSQKQKYQTLVSKVKQLSLQQGILQNKVLKLQQTIRIKSKQISQLQKNKNQFIKSSEKYREDIDKQVEKLRELHASLAGKMEEVKDYEKMAERTKKNYNLMEQKIRNIQHMQSNKKLGIKELEQQIKCLKDDKEVLISQINTLQKSMEVKRQQLIKIQLKIQDNKLSMQSLSDINKSVTDMMIRQSELKRNLIQLQIQNKNLLQMKNNLLEDLRMKQYL